MKFEHTQVFNFEGALRGMRNPKERWDLSDSCFGIDCSTENVLSRIPKGNSFEILTQDGDFFTFASIGKEDMKLAQRLIRLGNEHRKFMRQILVSVDITAPLYWYKEFDTYKIGTTANSTSTMHKIASKPITLDCFEIDDYDNSINLIDPLKVGTRANAFIDDLEQLRQLHLQFLNYSKNDKISKDEQKRFFSISKKYWKELIRWLPNSWLQKRTITMTYENLLAMCSKGQRRFHKLNEWSGKDTPEPDNFIKWARTLPYAQELIFIDEFRIGGEEE